MYREERSGVQTALQTKIQRQVDKAEHLRREMDRIEGAIESITYVATS